MQLEATSYCPLMLTVVALLVSQTTHQGKKRREEHEPCSEDFFLQLSFEVKSVLLQDTRITEYSEKEMCL